MKNLIFTTAFMLTSILCTKAQQNWIISNNPNFSNGSTNIFSSIDAACQSNEVQAGDVLLVQGSGLSYGNVTISKSVVIYCPGNFFGSSNDVQVYNYAPVKFSNITITAENVYLAGVQVTGDLTIQATNTIIQRNRIHNLYIAKSNATISQNYCLNWCRVTASASGLVFSNNFLNEIGRSNSGVSMDGIAVNNIILRCWGFQNNTYYIPRNIAFQNNIIQNLGGATSTSYNNTFSHNIIVSNGSSIDGINGNQVVADWAALFDDYGNGSTDAQWQLSQNSEAKQAGLNGIDCGMFGGTEPYVLNGVPAIPQIYEFNTPTSATGSGLDVQIKAKSNQ